MISLWVYAAMTILLTAGYALLVISASGSTHLITLPRVLVTFLLCAGVSTMFLIAIDGALSITYGDIDSGSPVP